MIKANLITTLSLIEQNLFQPIKKKKEKKGEYIHFSSSLVLILTLFFFK